MKTTTDTEIKEVILMMLDHLLRGASKEEPLIAEEIALDRKNFAVSFLVRFADESKVRGGGSGAKLGLKLSTLKPLQRQFDTEEVEVTSIQGSANEPRLRVTYHNVFRNLRELVY